MVPLEALEVGHLRLYSIELVSILYRFCIDFVPM
jgi:hypothetical protein